MVIFLGYRTVVNIFWSNEMEKEKKKSVVQNIIFIQCPPPTPKSPKQLFPKNANFSKKEQIQGLDVTSKNRGSVFM